MKRATTLQTHLISHQRNSLFEPLRKTNYSLTFRDTLKTEQIIACWNVVMFTVFYSFRLLNCLCLYGVLVGLYRIRYLLRSRSAVVVLTMFTPDGELSLKTPKIPDS